MADRETHVKLAADLQEATKAAIMKGDTAHAVALNREAMAHRQEVEIQDKATMEAQKPAPPIKPRFVF